MRLPFSNGNAVFFVADLPVLGLAALATIRDELASSAVLEHGTVAWHAAVGALLGREGVLLRSYHHASRGSVTGLGGARFLRRSSRARIASRGSFSGPSFLGFFGK